MKKTVTTGVGSEAGRTPNGAAAAAEGTTSAIAAGGGPAYAAAVGSAETAASPEETAALLLQQEQNAAQHGGRWKRLQQQNRRSSKRVGTAAAEAAAKRTRAEVPRGLFSLLINILMYALQQFMLLYVIVSKTKSWLALLFLIWDVPLLLYMCYSIKADSRADPIVSSRRCAVQWMVYTTTVAVKMAVVAFAPGNRSQQSLAFLDYARSALEALQQSESSINGADLLPQFLRHGGINAALAGQVNLSLSNNSEFMGQLVQAGENADNFLVFVGICLLPVIYVVFTARAKAVVYPTANQLVSVEGLLHADLAFSMTLDLLDIVVMFRDSFGRFNSARWLGTESVMKWICFAMVILTIVGVTCLGFAFPTRAADSRAAVASSLSRTDMFISAKYAFLVGLFMVDIPYLALRIYWIVDSDAVSFFMFKNVYCLLTRPLRLNQCRLAEREKAKGTQKSFYDQDALPAEYRRAAAAEEEEAALAEEEEEEEEKEEEEEEERTQQAAVAGAEALELRRQQQLRDNRLLLLRPGGGGGGGGAAAATAGSRSYCNTKGNNAATDGDEEEEEHAEEAKVGRGRRLRKRFAAARLAETSSGHLDRRETPAVAGYPVKGKYERDEEYGGTLRYRHQQPRLTLEREALHATAAAGDSQEEGEHPYTAAVKLTTFFSPSRRFVQRLTRATAAAPSADTEETSSSDDSETGSCTSRRQTAATEGNLLLLQSQSVGTAFSGESAEEEESCSLLPGDCGDDSSSRDMSHDDQQLCALQLAEVQQQQERVIYRTMPLHCAAADHSRERMQPLFAASAAYLSFFPAAAAPTDLRRSGAADANGLPQQQQLQQQRSVSAVPSPAPYYGLSHEHLQQHQLQQQQSQLQQQESQLQRQQSPLQQSQVQQQQQPQLHQRFHAVAVSSASPQDTASFVEAHHPVEQQQYGSSLQHPLLLSRPGGGGHLVPASAHPAAAAGGRPIGLTVVAAEQQQEELQQQLPLPPRAGRNVLWRRLSTPWVPRSVPAAAAAHASGAMTASGGEGLGLMDVPSASACTPWMKDSRGTATAAATDLPGALARATAGREEAAARGEGGYSLYGVERSGRAVGLPAETMMYSSAFPGPSPLPGSVSAPPLQPSFGRGAPATTQATLRSGLLQFQGYSPPPAAAATERAAADRAAGGGAAAAPDRAAATGEGASAAAQGGGLRKRISSAFLAFQKKGTGERLGSDAGGGTAGPSTVGEGPPGTAAAHVCPAVAYVSPAGVYVSPAAGRNSVGGALNRVEGLSVQEKLPQARRKRLTCRERWKRRRERKLLNDLKYVRGIPVKNIGMFKCLWRFIRVLFHGGREGLRTMLDDVFVLPYLQQLRLLLSPVSYHAMTLALFVLLLFSTPTTAEKLPGIAGWGEFFPVTKWQESAGVDRTAVVCVCVAALQQLLFYIFSAPILDVIFVSVGASVRLLSKYMMLRSFAMSFAQQLLPSPQLFVDLPFSVLQHTQHINGSRFVGLGVACVFLALPAYRLLTLCLPTCFALCGKRYVSFKREKKKGTHDCVSCEEDPSLWVHAQGLCGNRNLYTVSNAILFFACRHSLAPLSMNSLLCGPDVFKDIRLLDNLAHAHVCDVVVLVLLQFYALTMQLSWYMLGVFLGHDFFLIIYLIIAQAVRIMAQRRYEVKLLLQELVLQRNDGLRLPEEEDEDEEEEYGGFERKRKKTKKAVRFFTLADVEEEYQTEGYFSSPGCIFPQFI